MHSNKSLLKRVSNLEQSKSQTSDNWEALTPEQANEAGLASGFKYTRVYVQDTKTAFYYPDNGRLITD